MKEEPYIIRGGIEGRERLRILSRVMRPTTLALFEAVGVRPGMTCLDVGCGGGDVSVDLARLVGPAGRVVGTDLDDAKLALARSEASERQVDNIEYRRANIVDGEEAAHYDLAYARFLLTHLPDPADALAGLYRVLRPGGALVVEDIDVRGHFCYPEFQPFQRYVALYTDTAMRRGVDPHIGPRLPRLLKDTGLTHVRLNVVQPAALEGDAKLVCPLTLENFGPAALREGLTTEDELEQLIDELYAFARNPETVMSLPRVVQSWGHRPSH